MNEGDHQVRAAHKILGYYPIQKSFAAPKYVIKAKDPRFQKITVAEHGFFFLRGSSAQEAAEAKEGGAEGEEQVIELDQSEDELDRKSTRLNSSHLARSRMPSSA